MRNKKEQLKIERGDTAALAAFIRQYYPEILRYCKRHAPDIDAAEDAAQEVFLKASRYLCSDDFQGNFRAFLYQIARNTCLDMQKNRWKSVLSLCDVSDEPQDFDTSIRLADNRIDIEAALSGLDDLEREIIQLRFGQDLKLKEIGVILDLPLRTVQSKIRKALQKMRHDMEVK